VRSQGRLFSAAVSRHVPLVRLLRVETEFIDIILEEKQRQE